MTTNNNNKTTSNFDLNKIEEIKNKFQGFTLEMKVTKTRYNHEDDIYLYIRIFYGENHKYIDECQFHDDIFFDKEDDKASSPILEYAQKENIPIEYEEAGNTCYSNKYIGCGCCQACVYDDDGFPIGCNA